MAFDHERFIADMTAVACFLAMAERENVMLNGYTGDEALEAFGRLVHIPAFRLRELARNPAVNAIIQEALLR